MSRSEAVNQACSRGASMRGSIADAAILAGEVERLNAQLSSARASLRTSIPNDVAFARKRDYDAMKERATAAETRVAELEAQLKATMQAGGYEHFTAQVRNANQQAHNAIYVAQQLEKKVAELEAQNAELIAETHRWSAADKEATLQRDEQRRELIARAAATEARLKQQQAALEAAAAVFEALDGVDWPRNSFDAYHGHAGSCPVDYQAAQDAVSAALAASAEEPS